MVVLVPCAVEISACVLWCYERKVIRSPARNRTQNPLKYEAMMISASLRPLTPKIKHSWSICDCLRDLFTEQYEYETNIFQFLWDSRKTIHLIKNGLVNNIFSVIVWEIALHSYWGYGITIILIKSIQKEKHRVRPPRSLTYGRAKVKYVVHAYIWNDRSKNKAINYNPCDLCPFSLCMLRNFNN